MAPPSGVLPETHPTCPHRTLSRPLLCSGAATACPAAAQAHCRPKALSVSPHHTERPDRALLILPSLANWSRQQSTQELPRGPSTGRQVLSGHSARCQGWTAVPKPTGRVQPRTPTEGLASGACPWGKRGDVKFTGKVCRR